MASPAQVERFVFMHGFSFTGYVGEIRAASPEEVVPALELLEQRLAGGLHAAGFLSYEAASALNWDLSTCAPGGLPLLWFGLFEERQSGTVPQVSEPYRTSAWHPSLSEEHYSAAVASIRELIEAGDCYQVNFTMRQRFAFSGSPRAYFSELCRSQPTPYSCYLETGSYRILSASPELFFSLSDGILTTRPMKGTARRGRWFEEDEAEKLSLRSSPKELAENLMIVDLLRNDMGMVSRIGSVQADSLFDVESHASVHQMTSTITSRIKQGVGPLQLLRALFPCGSITGAPKRRSMEIIAELEREPRGIYTGALGYFSPGGDAQFSVAIRTVLLDLATGRGELGIGSGITHDSAAASEYAECLAKGRFAREQGRDFHLIESLLFDGGYFLLERHLERLGRSAAYFGFPFDPAAAREVLQGTAAGCTDKVKVRLLLFRDGRLSCEALPLETPQQEASAGFAGVTVDSADPFLYHKTSWRGTYTEELARHPELTEVIFLNERGEVTEGANSNIVALLDGELVTPPLASGLLPGIFRGELLASGSIRERVLSRGQLEGAEEVYLVNSVRKWRRVRLVVESSDENRI
jgi:para-aminobenzoate synthetase / 4-amino-4-deoxychorismate lyase